MRSKSGLTIAAVPLILLTACSPTLAAPATPCDLITREAAAAVFGGPVAAGREEKIAAGTAQCVFDGPGSNHSIYAGWMDPKALMGVPAAAAFKVAQMDKSQPSESISGIGEAALFSTSAMESKVTILYRERLILVGTVGSKNPGVKAALIQAAKQIIGKM
jgi:hypothetical protein